MAPTGSIIRLALAGSLLAAQLFSIAYARMTPKRFFCWAPNDYVTDFKLKVTVHGRELGEKELVKRYGLNPAAPGVYENPAEHLIGFISQYESTYGRRDAARVELVWTVNGHGPERIWRWPEQHNQSE